VTPSYLFIKVPANGLALLTQEPQNAGYREDQFPAVGDALHFLASLQFCGKEHVCAALHTHRTINTCASSIFSVSQRSFAQANPLTANEWCKWAPSHRGLVRSSFAIVGEKPNAIKGELK
jgi:hypothetical protein